MLFRKNAEGAQGRHRKVIARLTATLIACLILWSQTIRLSAQEKLSPATMPKAQSEEGKRPVQRLFISGHSLTNEPIPSYLEAIAKGFGLPLSWNRQYLEGSSIKQRSLGDGGDTTKRVGYTRGLDYKNAPVNVLMEFQKPSRHPDVPYDALLITEQSALLGSLVWNDTVFYLRKFQDRFAAHNPKGVTYFYEPWLSLDSKNDPNRWITYEKAAAPVWDCIVSEMNRTIVSEGRYDRIVRIPAALALVDLIERATTGPGLLGITRESARSTIDSLVEDDVHLTPLGAYYMALTTFAAIFEQSPEGAWLPSEVTEEQARALQRVAAEFAMQKHPPAMPLSACRDYVLRSFLWKFLGYADQAFWRKERGYFGSLFFRSKLAFQWFTLFRNDSAENPFSEASYKRR
jgi:hypothetical protein